MLCRSPENSLTCDNFYNKTAKKILLFNSNPTSTKKQFVMNEKKRIRDRCFNFLKYTIWYELYHVFKCHEYPDTLINDSMLISIYSIFYFSTQWFLFLCDLYLILWLFVNITYIYLHYHSFLSFILVESDPRVFSRILYDVIVGLLRWIATINVLTIEVSY